MTRIKRTAIAVGVAATAAVAGPAVAQADTGQSMSGYVASGPVNMQLSAQNAGGVTSGSMHGAVRVGNSEPVTADGTVSCYQKQNDKIGMFVRFTGTKPAIMGAAVKGMYVNIDTNGQGHATSLSYIMTPKSSGDCKPALTMLPATGDISTTG